MIRVLSFSVYKADDSKVLLYESFRDKQFNSNKEARLWAEYLEHEYSKAFKCDVRIYLVRRAKPEKEIDMMSVLMNTANVMGQDFNMVIEKGRKRELVDVRKTAVMILFDLDYNAMDIERGLPFKDRAVYDYRTKMEDRFMTERGYEEKYESIKKKVLKLTFEKDEKD